MKTKWQGKLQNQYDSFEEFERHCRMYDNHLRLGFRSPKEAWDENPEIEGSVDPRDYERVDNHPGWPGQRGGHDY